VDEGDRPAHDEVPRPVAPGSDPRFLYVVIALLVGVVALLVVRPWPDGPGEVAQPPAEPAGPTSVAGRTPSGTVPTGAADPDGASLVLTCGTPSGWRVATLQAWRGRTTPIRSWIAIEPVDAAGPLDPAIPFAPVATDVVTAIGYCAPPDEGRRPPASVVVDLWAIRAGRAIRLTAAPLEPRRPNALGGLWRAAPQTGSASATWPPGLYVIEITSASGTFHRLLGIEVADLARLRAPSPTPVPPASPAASSGPSPTAPGAASPDAVPPSAEAAPG
jgi:hypothetical protein